MKSKISNSPKKSPQKESKRKSIKEKVLLKEKPKAKEEKEEENPKGEEEEKENPIIKPKNIERFIYISTYTDSNLMSTLTKLFEEINQKAFNFQSAKEINTYALSKEEQENNEIDYISGFQIIDENIRITILEGITGKAMQRVKELIPKIKLNDKKIKLLADTNVLFDTRLYSKFNLSLKLIKLRNNLKECLETYPIYENANRIRQIYDCFQSLGSLLRVETMEEVERYKIFPTVEGLLLLERKHGDMITYQDMTGVFKERKKVKKINVKHLTSEKSSLNTLNSRYSGSISNNNSSEIIGEKKIIFKDIKDDNKIRRKIYICKSQDDINGNKLKNKLEQEYQEKIKNIHKLKLKPKVISRNDLYDKFLEEKNNQASKTNIWENNLKYIEELKRKIPTYKKFCRPCKPGEEIIKRPKQILFCPTKKNYFDAVVKKMREKYIKDTKHHYSYSNYSMAFSFPMIDTGVNMDYVNYLENKKKWRNNKDFERFKQPEKEKYFFPKIKNFL